MAKKKTLRDWKQRMTSSEYSEDDLAKIRQRAYYIWESKGRPENSSLDNWLEAERKFRS